MPENSAVKTKARHRRSHTTEHNGEIVKSLHQTLPCLTHLSRSGSLQCWTTAWTSLVVSPATGVSLTSSKSSSWWSLPLWQSCLPGRSSPITGNCPFSAPPFSCSPRSPSSFLQRTLSWTLLVQWFFLFFKLLDMAQTRENHIGATVDQVLALFEVPNSLRNTLVHPISIADASCIHVSAHTHTHSSWITTLPFFFFLLKAAQLVMPSLAPWDIRIDSDDSLIARERNTAAAN